ncbi:MAG: zinc ribbon domain-containing protein [Anaerolineae bacterium]|nr:zinc ribbon domain-containing protein [Anaerolineae bacterium]
MLCPNCGAPVSAGAKFCGQCGATLPTTRLCPSCGASIAPTARFCGTCGAPVESNVTVSTAAEGTPPAPQRRRTKRAIEGGVGSAPATTPTEPATPTKSSAPPAELTPHPVTPAASVEAVTPPEPSTAATRRRRSAAAPPAASAPAATSALAARKPRQHGGRTFLLVAGVFLVVCVGLAAVATHSDRLLETLTGAGSAGPSLRPSAGNTPAATGNTQRAARPLASPLPTTRPIAEATLGPEGGQISVPNELSLQFPAGALAQQEKLVIRRLSSVPNVGSFYSIERSGGDAPLAKPVRVTFTLPAGVPPADVVVAQAVSEAVGVILPSQVNPAERSITVEVSHFSWLSWVKRTVLSGVTLSLAAMLVGGVATGTLFVQPSTAAIYYYFTVGMTASVAGGNDVLNDLYRKYGLDSAYVGQHFQVYWASSGANAMPNPGPALTYYLDADKNVKQVFNYWNTEEIPGLTRVVIPAAVGDLLSELETARDYYRLLHYELPRDQEPLKVVIRAEVAKAGGAGHYGGWDGTYLHLDNSNFQSDAKMERMATVAHEYWHAYSDLNGVISSRFTFMDECLATAYENEVFPWVGVPTDQTLAFLVGRQLGYGLLDPPTDYDALLPDGADLVASGYNLWPWCKYLLHRTASDHSQIRQLISGGMRDEELLKIYEDFTRALLTTERDLGSSVSTPRPDGTMLTVPTSWEETTLDKLYLAYLKRLQNYDLTLGRAELNDLRDQPRPRAFSLLRLYIATPAADKPPLVVRRLQPDEQEQVIVLRSTGDLAFPKRVSYKEMVVGNGGVMVPAEWMAGKKFIHLALVGLLPKGEASPFLVYYLRPPARLGLMPAEEGDPAGSMRLGWPMAELAPDLPPQEGLAGYRIVYEVDGKVTDYQDESGQPPLIKPTDIQVVLTTLPQRYTRLGILSEDAALLGSDGHPLRSAITWLEQPGGLIVTFAPGCRLGAEVPSVNDPRFTETVEITEGDLHIRVTDRNQRTLDSPSVHCVLQKGCTLEMRDLDPAQLDRLTILWTNLPFSIAGRAGASKEYEVIWQKYAGIPQWEAMLREGAGAYTADYGRMDLSSVGGRLALNILFDLR